MSSFIREFWIARARRLEALQGLFRSIPLHAMQSWARTGDVVLERVVPCMLHLALELAKTCIKAGRAVANQRKATKLLQSCLLHGSPLFPKEIMSALTVTPVPASSPCIPGGKS